MIDTLMALWNRGYSGRGIMTFIAFVIICISISLLLITVGGTWTSLFLHRPSSNQRSSISAADLTATAQASAFQPVADNTATILAPTATPTATSNPCITSTPHSVRTPAVRGSATARRGSGGYPGKPTPTPTHPRPTPTPIKATPTPTPTPKPTYTPGITPTVTNTPVVTPTDTPTPVVTVTPTPTNTPTPVVTVTPTPTSTPTPGVTPTATPTVTPTVNATPTTTVGVTPTDSPTVGVTATSPSHLRGGTPIVSSTPTAGQGQQGNGTAWNPRCLRGGAVGDTLYLNNDGSIAASLERDVWFILGGSAVGTMLFYGAVYMKMRKKSKQRRNY